MLTKHSVALVAALLLLPLAAQAQMQAQPDPVTRLAVNSAGASAAAQEIRQFYISRTQFGGGAL